MTMESFSDDEKVKFHRGYICSYCGSSERITFDHVIPRSRNGHDSGDNMVAECRTCNSLKKDKDLLAWCIQRHEFPHLMVLRRYLKIAVQIYCDAEVMDCFLVTPDLEAFRYLLTIS